MTVHHQDGVQVWLKWGTGKRHLGRWARYCPLSPNPLPHAIQRPEDYNYGKRVVLDMPMLHSVVAMKDNEFSLGDVCE